jgi:hypothetical protein
VQEVDDVYPQSVSHEEQVRQLHLVPGFHALDRGPVDAGGVGEGLLSHRLLEASHAGRGDPLGQFGWHATNRLRIMIISQQQI